MTPAVVQTQEEQATQVRTLQQQLKRYQQELALREDEVQACTDDITRLRGDCSALQVRLSPHARMLSHRAMAVDVLLLLVSPPVCHLVVKLQTACGTGGHRPVPWFVTSQLHV